MIVKMLNKEQISREEIANTITHGAGFILSIFACYALIYYSYGPEKNWLLASAIIFGCSMLMAYGSSSLYHGIQQAKIKALLQRVDHASIYLLIAGTYTPFSLVLLRNADWWGWFLFITIWILAIAGVIIKLFFMGSLKKASLVSYVVMGWLAIVAIKPLSEFLTTEGLYWLLAGGISYSIGVIFYKWEKLPYSHAIWHIFVLGGTVCHFFCVLLFIYP